MQTIAADPDIVLPESYRFDGDVVPHLTYHPAPPVTRQCIACGVVRDCDPALPCGECGASSFHLIPLPPEGSAAS